MRAIDVVFVGQNVAKWLETRPQVKGIKDMKFRSSQALTGMVALSLAALLAGCSGNTYGTGVSSEKQLLKDVTSLVSLGSADDKPRISYNSRPKLVKAPQVAALPTPAETITGDAGYFPEDPELKRKRLLEQLENGDGLDEAELSPEIVAMRQESLERSRRDALTKIDKEECDHVCDVLESQEGRKRMLEKKNLERELNGVKKRRYLTEPPDEYRTPAETAEIGVVGEEETTENGAVIKKKKKSLLGSIFGG